MREHSVCLLLVLLDFDDYDLKPFLLELNLRDDVLEEWKPAEEVDLIYKSNRSTGRRRTKCEQASGESSQS